MKSFKNNSITVLAIYLVLGAVLLFPLITKAQGPPDSNSEIFTDPDLPIDGGVGLLIAAGVAYGATKVRAERKKRKEL